MSHGFLQQLDETARRLRRVAGQTTLRATIAAAIGLTLALILLDRLSGFEDTGLRWLATAALVTLTAIAATRFARRNRRDDATRLGVAQRLQELQPEVGSRLASAVQFAESEADDPTAGSAELRRSVVLETASGAGDLAYDRVVDTTPLRRATGALCGSAAACALFALLAWPTLAQGIVRLAAPWTHAPWPRTVALQLVEPVERLPRGEAFEATATNAKGPLPADTRVEYRFAADDGTLSGTETVPAQLVGDRAVATRDAVQQSFQYRFVGGDDDTMAWASLEVVDPPHATELVVSIDPPAYSGLPSEESSGPVRVLAGSRLSISASLNEAIDEAEVALPGDEVLPMEVRSDGAGAFRGGWVAKPPASAGVTNYEVRFSGASGVVGIEGPHTYDVRPDAPPTVEWRTTAEDLWVTSRALIAIAGAVTDNLATKRVELEWRPFDAEDAPAQRLVIDDRGPDPPTRQSLAEADRIDVDYDWDLEPLGFEAGAELSAWLVATDYQPAEGRTDTPRRVLVVSDEEYRTRLAEEQSRLLAQVEQSLSLQREANTATQQLRADTRDSEAIDRAALDRLTSIEIGQRETSDAVGDPLVGAAAQAAKLVEDLRRSRLEEPDLQTQLTAANRALTSLSDKPLPDARSALAGARRAGQRSASGNEPAASAQEFAGRLDEASAAQTEAIDRLERVAESLTSWADYRKFAEEAAALERLERQLATESQREAAAAATGIPNEAAREKLVLRQAEATRRFDKLRQSMQRLLRTQPTGAEDRPAAADAVGDALAEADDADVGGRLRDASRDLALGRLGGASQSQTQAADGLRSMLEALRERATNDPEELARRLREEKERLAEVQEKVDSLRQRPDSPRTQTAREETAERAARLGRRLERLTASQAASSTSQGAQQTAGQQGGRSPRQELADAQQSFEQAQQEIDQRLRELENQQTQRLLDQLAERIGGYIEEQGRVLEETLGLDSELESSARPDRVQIEREATELAETQRDLAGETSEFAEQLSKRAVFELALSGAAERMSAAARRLDEARVDKPTQRAESGALARLRHIEEVLRQNQQDRDDQQGQGGGGGGGGGEPPPPSPIDVAELKMLRLMQLEVLSETDAYESDTAAARRRGERLPADWRETGRDLADRQRRLAELTVELAERRTDPETVEDQPAEP